jgi:hypothetical protein
MKSATKIRFTATLLRAKGSTNQKSKGRAFLILPKTASAKLPSRGMVSVEGTFNRIPFQATLDPDGQGSHWLKLDRKLSQAVGSPDIGDVATLEIAPVPLGKEPEPTVPADLKKALAAAPQKARDTWSDVTPVARRDWIHWIVSPKQAATRARRIKTACDMLAKGKRRPCCFDRSGMYSNSLSCPVADES